MLSKLNKTYKQPELIVGNPGPGSIPRSTTIGSAKIELADVADRYTSWPKPTVIVSDGA